MQYSKSMPQFRWPEVENDIALAREVASKRPSKMLDWEAIAQVLSTAFSPSSKPVHIKGRGCKERMERLLAKFRSDDRQALKRCVILLVDVVLTYIFLKTDQELKKTLPRFLSYFKTFLITKEMLRVLRKRNEKLEN